jgi:hypothetical protein
MHLLKLKGHAIQRRMDSESLADLLEAEFHRQVS